jgi:hypothetical protein
MKILLLFFQLLVSSLVFAIQIEDAVKSNLIKLQVQSTGEHLGKCVTLKISNTSDKDLNIEINAGLYLDHEDSTSQDHIITENTVLFLKKNEIKTIIVNGLCCERHKSAPKENSFFSIAKVQPKATSELAAMIAKYPKQEYTEQKSMWCLIEKDNPNSEIEGEDSAKVMELRNFVGKKNGFPIAKYATNNYAKPTSTVRGTLQLKIKGNQYLERINENDIVETSLFDSDGMKVDSFSKEKCLKQNIRSDRRMYNIVFDINRENLDPSKRYYLRFKVNGVTQKEFMFNKRV